MIFFYYFSKSKISGKDIYQSIGSGEVIFIFFGSVVIFLYFLQFFERKKIWNSEKNTFHFSRFDSQIVLNKYGFSYFSYIIQHILNVGKIRNGPKVASFDLYKWLIFFYLKSDFWQILRFQYITLFYCTQMAPNAPEMNKNHLFWVRTHFGCFKPWFGAIILLFYHSFWRRG